MTIRHLEVFIAVVDAQCSISRAAEHLHVAQPAVTRTIADLENHYGAPLFERLNRRLSLSAAGERLLDKARRLTDSFRHLDLEMCTGTANLPLRIGATYTVGTSFLPGLLRYRNEKHGRCPANVVVRNTSIIEKDLLDSTLDVGIVEGSIVSSDIVEMAVTSDEVIMVASHEIARAMRKRKFADTLPRIIREPGSGTHDVAVRAFPFPPSAPVWTIANTQAMIEMTEAGLGVAILSRLLVADWLKTGALVQVGKREVKRTFRLVHHKDKFLDERMTTFIADAREYGSRTMK